MNSAKTAIAPTLSNHEIVVLAVYMVGGDVQPVDTEDVAVKAHELAPERFSWRKHADQINLDAVRKRLWDAKSAVKGLELLRGGEREGWTVTPKGAALCKQLLASFENVNSRSRSAAVRWIQVERIRLLQTEAFKKYSDGNSCEITERDAKAFFRIDEYLTIAARNRKIDRLQNAFRDDPVFDKLISIVLPLVGTK